MLYLLALFIGIVAGLRAMTAPAAISWAAWLGLLDLSGSWISFLASPWAVGILSVLALAELVTDQLPSTPSRKVPQQFGGRIVTGAVCGAALGIASGFWIAGLVLGVAGAVLGTLGGAAARQRLAAGFGRDLPAGLVEDAVAILAALAIVWSL
ncbi:DUF4126 family protein [Martelella soudanensis]|uniref:DUF4126 family protein n=1 Tax=unclassified Martelella TaxID=2629616 RepID=UPI0015DE89BB|nr:MULTISPECIES: DUF4126 family protein [unclassified Martelella]